MTKRYYYTCPIKAAYMAKEFGVKLYLDGKNFYSIEHRIEMFNKGVCEMELTSKTDSSNDRDLTSTGEQRYIKQPTGFEERIYVAKESERIFKPIEGDAGVDQFSEENFYLRKEVKGIGRMISFWENIGDKEDGEEIEIIMRDNKQFFMGEIEND